jgi:phosphomannomutase
VLAHDPDADRLAVGARDQAGTLRMLSGDEVGLLLGAHMLSRHDGPEKPLVVSTVVSSLALAHVAEASGARFAQSLTGFKWIADKGRELESKEGLRYVFGYEEAIGYAFAELGADKDGIAAAALIVELTGALAARGENLPSELERLSRAHGLFVSRQLTFQHEGDAGKECIAAIMAKARDVAPEVLLGTGAQRIDYALRTPRADLLVFHDASSNRICVRPSGTEPKLKLYLHARTDVGASESMASARARASSQLDALERSAKTLTER